MTIKNIILYNLLFPIFFVIIFVRFYKSQMINENELILYNIITREWIDYHEV